MFAPLLTSLYTHCLKIGTLPPSMSEANVILIHKPPKDPKLFASYRPIAFNNVVKILTKLQIQSFDAHHN